MSLKFTSYASGSGGNFYIIDDGGDKLAIECGIRFKDIQIATGFKVTELQGCLISHAHGDHAKSVKEMMENCVNCYASLDTWEKLPNTHYSKPLLGLYQYQIGSFIVKPFHVPHDEGEAGTLGFMVMGKSGETLLYITDMAYMPHPFEGVTIIATEANFCEDILHRNVDKGYLHIEVFKRVIKSHCSIQRVVKMLTSNDLKTVKQIYLMHLSNGNSNAAEFKEKVQRATGIHTTICLEKGMIN